jgi:signal transduction histidine kinase
MTSDIAHDLRTPLTLLLGYTEVLSEGKLEGTPEILNTMHQQAQHLSYLIDDLKTLSLLDSDELNFQIQNINPVPILGQLEAAFKQLAAEKGITIKTEIPADLPRAELDPDRLTQILGNLINNALDVLSPEGVIQITAHGNEGQLFIQVSDDGPGISEDDLPHIFNRSFRIDESRGGPGSSGLGLAITKKLVEAMGGEIRVTSVVSKGTRFSISFPTHRSV